MEPHLVIDPKLTAILDELQRREPIFHRSEFGTTRESFGQMMDADFWEVGASGRRYSREYVLDALVERQSVSHNDLWETSGFHCAELGSDTYLVTYTLVQNKTRLTRRATIWRRTGGGWKVLYHQGTIVQGPERELSVPSNHR